jgi:hypothetical protein
MARVAWHRIPSLALLLLVGCSSDPAVVTLEIVVGHEADTMSRAPAVARVDVSVRSVVSDFTTSASAPPGGAFDLGEVPSDELFVVEATGFDAANLAVVRGRSLAGVSFLSAAEVMPLFVQRIGEWARPPNGIERAHVDAPAAPFAERYVMSSGGTEAAGASGDAGVDEVEFYDLYTYSAAVSQPLPRVPESLVTRGSAALLLGDGGATWIDFASGNSDNPAVPLGLSSYGDVTRGKVIEADEGGSFVVGATREEPATAAVVRIAADGGMTALSLGAARAGAAAAWVPEIGLVVVGGSDEAAGVEVLAPGASTFVTRDFPPDATRGAGAAAAGGTLLLVGGEVAQGSEVVSAPTRIVDATCASSCAATVLDSAAPPATLSEASAWATASGRVVVVAEDAALEQTRTFLVDPSSATLTELELREARVGATAIPAPNGTLAIVGGRHPDGTPALAIELLFVE